MTSVIQIYGKPFSIGFDEKDNTRRRTYFGSGTGSLTPQEKSLMLSIGIDSMLENSLKPYLAEFFSSLQTCSSDTSLLLSRSCETAYFVIWSALFHNRAEIARRMKQDKGGVIDDLDLAQDAAFISGFKKPVKPTKPKVPAAEPVPGLDPFQRLFTLMILGEADGAPVSEEDALEQLFTLMIIGNDNDSIAETTDFDI